MHQLGTRQRWMLRLVADLSNRQGRAVRSEVCLRFGPGAEAMILSLQTHGHLERGRPDQLALGELGRRVLGL